MANLPAPALALLERQFGAVARFQLQRWLTLKQIDGMVRHERLIPVERGVYRALGGASMPEQAAMAAVLRARPGACITGPLVLGILNIDGFSRAHPFEVLTAPGRALRGVAFPHRRNPTPADLRASFEDLPIVTPTVALVDAARHVDRLGERKLRLGLEVLKWRGLTSEREVLSRAEVLGPRDVGARFFRELIGDEPTRFESDGERRLDAILAAFDPAPETQVWVTATRRVDRYWRRYRLAIEYLGTVDHAYATARARDAERDAELHDLQIRIFPVVARDLSDPAALLAGLTASVQARAYELGVDPPRRRDAGVPVAS